MEPSCKVEYITSNIEESFNDWVEQLKFMPLVKLIDELRTRLIEFILVRIVTNDGTLHQCINSIIDLGNLKRRLSMHW